MKQDEPIKPSGTKKFPYFRKGVLAFKKSGHTLTRNEEYYVCSKKQKQECNEPEKRIKATNFERDFSRLTKTFAIPEDRKEKVAKEMVRKIAYAFMDNLIDGPDFYKLIGITTDAMRADLDAGQTDFLKSDIKTVKDQLVKDAEHNTRFITAIFLATVMSFARGESETEMGKILGYLSEKVYLSDDGKVEKHGIQLCPLGDYIFQFLQKEMPLYREPFKWFTPTKMPNPVSYQTLLTTISTEGLGEMMPPLVVSAHVLAQAFQMFGKLGGRSPQDAINEIIAIQNSPIMQGGISFVPPQKMKKKRVARETKEGDNKGNK